MREREASTKQLLSQKCHLMPDLNSPKTAPRKRPFALQIPALWLNRAFASAVPLCAPQQSLARLACSSCFLPKKKKKGKLRTIIKRRKTKKTIRAYDDGWFGGVYLLNVSCLLELLTILLSCFSALLDVACLLCCVLVWFHFVQSFMSSLSSPKVSSPSSTSSRTVAPSMPVTCWALPWPWGWGCCVGTGSGTPA